MKKIAIFLAIFGVFTCSLLALDSVSAAVLQGFQGGTGISTSTSANDGKCLTESSSSPFLTWNIGTCGSGGGSGSGNVTVSPTSSVIADSLLYYITAASSTVAPTSSIYFDPANSFIGIGTASPASLLDVYNGRFDVDNPAPSYFLIGYDATDTGNASYFDFGPVSTNWMTFGTNFNGTGANRGICFVVGNGGSDACPTNNADLVVATSGFIGIGTSMPSSTLHVIGSFTQSGALVSLASTTVKGQATTTNLSVTALGTSGSNCLTANSTGFIATTTCGTAGALTGNGTSPWGAYYTGASTLATNTIAFVADTKGAGGIGNIAVGSSTTNGLFSVVNASNTTSLKLSSTTSLLSSSSLLDVGSSSAVFQILADGHLNATGTTPTMGTCGSSPSVIGNDAMGTITVGSGVVTSCTMNFAVSYETTQFQCISNDNSAAISSAVTSQTTSTVTFGTSATLGGGRIFYFCGENL